MNKSKLGFIWSGSIMTILFFAIVNLITSRSYPWFIYPAFCILWFPLFVYFITKRDTKGFSIAGGILLTVFLVLTNYLFSPDHPWFLYALPSVLLWPVIVCMKKQVTTVSYAVAGCAGIISYYTILNIVLSPVYPWAIYPAFTVIWWPATLFFIKRKRFFAFSIFGSILTILFFTVVNIVSSQDEIWAVYPAFAHTMVGRLLITILR